MRVVRFAPAWLGEPHRIERAPGSVQPATETLGSVPVIPGARLQITVATSWIGDMYGDEGLARREPREGDPSLSRARRTPGGSGSRRIIRARAGGAAAPSSRPHCWRPTRDGVALQPRRAFWDKVTEFVFGC